MLEFLRESTFTVNEVLRKAWQLTKEHYPSLAVLCFLLFLTSTASTVLAFYLYDVDKIYRVGLALLFIMVFFTIYLTLTRYVLFIIDNEHREVPVTATLPSRRQVARFLLAAVYFMACTGAVYLLVMLLPLPVIYVLDKLDILTNKGTVEKIFNVFAALGFVALFMTWLRISFYPYFIIDRGAQPLESIKMSLAVTKGNFIKIVLLLLVMGGVQIIYFAFGAARWPVTATVINLLSCLVIVPLSAVALTVAYRKMVAEREADGDGDLGVIHNLL